VCAPRDGHRTRPIVNLTPTPAAKPGDQVNLNLEPLEGQIMNATRTTLKSFVAKNAGSLFIAIDNYFDGTVDGSVDSADKSFTPVVETVHCLKNTYGINGAWVAGGGNDYITHFSRDGFTGLEVNNCCRHFFIATKNN